MIKDKDIWAEEEFDDYLKGIYGLEYVAGYTDFGITYGITHTEEDTLGNN